MSAEHSDPNSSSQSTTQPSDSASSFASACTDDIANRIAQQLSQNLADGIAHQIANELADDIALKLSDQLLTTVDSAIRRANENSPRSAIDGNDEDCDAERAARIAELENEVFLLRDSNANLQAELATQQEANDRERNEAEQRDGEQAAGEARDAELIAELQAEIQSLQENPAGCSFSRVAKQQCLRIFGR